MSQWTQKNGATPIYAAGCAGSSASTWHRIAVRANDRMSWWRPLPDAKITVEQARALAGLDGNEQSPGCFVAQKIEGRQTFLVFKGPQV